MFAKKLVSCFLIFAYLTPLVSFATPPELYALDIPSKLYAGDWTNAISYIGWDGNAGALSKCEYRYDNDAYTQIPCTISFPDEWSNHITSPSAGISHTITLRATNASSEVGTTTSAPFTIVPDGTPLIFTYNPSNNQDLDPSGWFPYVDWIDNGTNGDVLSLCEYSYDNVVYYPVGCANAGSDLPYPMTSGAKTLYLRATDSLANVTTAQISFTFTASAPSGPHSAFCATASDVPTTECEALMDIYDTTGGLSWLTQVGWGTSTTICSWTGVTCSGGHVTELDLSGNNLAGNLSFTHGTLSSLATLSLSGNALTGLDLSGMNALTVLYMNDNLISTIQNVPNLPFGVQIYNGSNNCFLRSSMDPTVADWLDAFGVDWTRNVLCPVVPICDLVTDIPKAECDALMNIYSNNGGDNWYNKTGWGTADKVCTWGYTPWTGVTCTDGHVTALDLYNNNLTGGFAITQGNLNSLTNLSLSYNQLTSFSNAGLGALTSLALTHNSLTSFDATGLAALTSLQLGENLLTSVQNTDVLVNIGTPVFHGGQYPWTESFAYLNANCLRESALSAPLLSWVKTYAPYQWNVLNPNGLCPEAPPSPVTVTCSPSITSAITGQPVTWTATPSGGEWDIYL